MKSRLAWILVTTCALWTGILFPSPSSEGSPSPSAPRPLINSRKPLKKVPAQMAFVPGGVFQMGCSGCDLSDALPLHWVQISPFWMDETPVTNAAFARFVHDTHFITTAESKPDLKDYPPVSSEKWAAGSGVFNPPQRLESLDDPLAWWRYEPGAYWRQPEGPGSSIRHRRSHPVVHIAYPDAKAFCKWAGKRLPTEAEYEFAARGGLHGKKYAWGDELTPRGRWRANVWQGAFPTKNTVEDGFARTSPVRSFPPNGYGLFDMGGNVWQWTSDWYRPDSYARDASVKLTRDPQGPSASYDPAEPGVAKRVQRGGSFLCSRLYCTRYLVGSRGKGAPESAASHSGFRCVNDL